MNIVKKLATFIGETQYDKLPQEMVFEVKRALLDTIGVTIAGSLEPAGKIITGFVGKMGGKPAASVIGCKFRTSLPLAALANGTMGHALDYDDTGAGCQGHPSVAIFPAILALGEELESSGKEIITAYAVGVEVWSKLAACMPSFHLKGWHPTAVFGTLGAAAGASKLLNLSVEQTMMSVGLAVSEAAGLMKNFGTMTKPFHAGNAAQNGVVAAMLVKDGFTAAENILEGEFGFPGIYYGGEVDVSGMAENLGSPFAIIAEGLNIKKYPTCYCTHTAIDVMLDLVKKYEITPEQVEKIECLGPLRFKKVLFHTNPGNKLEAKFSMNFVMASAIVDHKVGLDQVTDERVKDPAIQELMKKVSLHSYEGPEDQPVTVTVRLKGGNQYSESAMQPRGHAGTPLSRDELLGKYEACARRVLDDSAVERSIELLENLDTLHDIKELMDIVRAS